MRDFGELNLALSVVTAVALLALARTAASAVAAAAGWLAYQVPHLVYHLRHLDLYDEGDQILNMASLGLSVALPIVVLVAVSRAHGSIAQAVLGGRSRG